MHIPAYLSISRHGIYYFRHPVPKAVSPTASTIRISLQTREPKQALSLAERLRYVALVLTRNGTDCRMTLDEFRNSLRTHFSQMLEAQKRDIRENGRLSPVVAYSMEDAVKSPYPSSFREKAVQNILDDPSIDEVLKKAGASAELSTDIRRAFRAEYRLADKAYMQAALQFNSTYEGYTFAEGTAATMPQPEKPALEGATLSQAIADFMAHMKLERRWIEKTEGERQEHIDLLYEVLGADRLVKDIAYNEARRVQQVLTAYPVNRHKIAETRGKSLDEVLAMDGLRTIHPLTINKYLQTYKSLFNWAKRVKLCKENPFDGLSLRADKVNEVEPRTAFPDAALNKIRTALAASPSDILDHHRWGH